MNGKIKEGIKNHYSEQNLTPEQLDRLNKLAIPEVKNPFKFNLLLWPSLVTALTIILITVWNPQINLNEKIVAEVVYNHKKQMEVEFLTSSISGIKTSLTKLDFVLADSKIFSTGNWKIIGARYCSIQGKLAAQIKLKSSSSAITYTLYQVAYSPEMHKAQISKFDSIKDGVKVRIWKEGEVLFALAGP